MFLFPVFIEATERNTSQSIENESNTGGFDAQLETGSDSTTSESNQERSLDTPPTVLEKYSDDPADWDRRDDGLIEYLTSHPRNLDPSKSYFTLHALIFCIRVLSCLYNLCH